MDTLLFYILAAAALLATLLCLTRRNPVHAVVYLIQALLALAMLYFLLGAPLLAAWHVVLYAGAIMILFLFVAMLLEPNHACRPARPRWHYLPALLLGGLLLGCGGALIALDPAVGAAVAPFRLMPRLFGQALFERYGLAVEIVSLQLLFAAVGAFHLGRRRHAAKEDKP
jgi:NADH-quinone oxidoreductase subunit J